jgi:hypothetical protein
VWSKYERDAMNTVVYGVAVLGARTAVVLIGYLAVRTFLLGS